MKHINTLILIISVLFFFLFSSCNREDFSSDPNFRLTFSVDTLSFDTVFTNLGSATKRIMVHNKNNKSLRISQISLAKQKNSFFKINVDGTNNPDHQFNDIEIRAKDSIYIFVMVNIKEQDSNTPILIEDHLLFQTNGNNQQVVLNAFGQNVEFLKQKTITNDTILTADKPYVIYDSLVIAPQKTLKLEAGSRLYFHNKANLIVYGNLDAQGTADNPILIRGDRFDYIDYTTPIPYNYVSGQWGSIILKSNDGKHTLKHVKIQSGYNGIQIQSLTEDAIPTPENMPNLELINCRIHNFQSYGLKVKNANVTVVNTEISNTGDCSVYLEGGKHTFIHSTIANFFNRGTPIKQPNGRKSQPAVMLMNLDKVASMQTSFINCVIAGSYSNELTLASQFPDLYNGLFQNCYIKRKDSLNNDMFKNIRWSKEKDIVFKNDTISQEHYYNFEPDSVSPVRGLGDPAIIADPAYIQYGLQFDLNGMDRTQNKTPDAGAYQWSPAITEEQ